MAPRGGSSNWTAELLNGLGRVDNTPCFRTKEHTQRPGGLRAEGRLVWPKNVSLTIVRRAGYLLLWGCDDDSCHACKQAWQSGVKTVKRKPPKGKQILPHSYFSLCDIYPLMFIALCHIPTKHSSWNVSYFQARILFPHVYLQIFLQRRGRIWYPYPVNSTHLHIFQKKKKKATLCRKRASDSLQVHEVT